MNDKSVFQTLSVLNVKSKVQRKGNLDYLSWANAWSMLKQSYPLAQRIVYEDPSIQRSTAKAIALHGLGLSLWIGEDITDTVTEAPKSKEVKVISLDVSDENYTNLVIPYMASNSHLGLEQIIKNLKTKYAISSSVKKNINKDLEKFLSGNKS